MIRLDEHRDFPILVVAIRMHPDPVPRLLLLDGHVPRAERLPVVPDVVVVEILEAALHEPKTFMALVRKRSSPVMR